MQSKGEEVTKSGFKEFKLQVKNEGDSESDWTQDSPEASDADDKNARIARDLDKLLKEGAVHLEGMEMNDGVTEASSE